MFKFFPWLRLPPFLLPLIFINLTGHMALSGGRLTGSMFVLNNGEPESLVGLYMALFSTIPVMTALAIGRWVDRAGAVRVMHIGVALVFLGAWLPVLYLSLPVLFVMAVAVGCGFNIMSVAAQHTVGHLVADSSPSERLANFGWFAMGHSASSVLGPFIAGFVIDSMGFRAAFASMAFASCISAILVATKTAGLPQAKRAPIATSNSKGEATSPDVTARPKVLDLLSSPELRRIYAVNVVMGASWDLFIVMLPVLGHRLGFSASVIGTVFSLFAVGTFSARAAMPWLSKRVNEWQIMRTAVVVIVVVFCLFPWSGLAPVLMALGLIFGCAVGMSQPSMLSLLHSAAPPGRGGEAVGLRSMIGNGVSIAIPLTFGAAVVPLGITPLLFVGATLFSMGIWPAHRGVVNRR